MFGLRKNSNHDLGLNRDADVVKLFFDAFSGRLASVEEGLRSISSEVGTLNSSQDSSKVSDLVLLERLQKLEVVVQESLTWIKKIAYTRRSEGEPVRREPESVPEHQVIETPSLSSVQRVITPGPQTGSLSLITTPTELQVLSLLAERGPMAAPEIGKVIGRSREHSARLMRKLFDQGYVRRDQTRIPFRYSLVDRVRQGFRRDVPQPESQQTATVAQN